MNENLINSTGIRITMAHSPKSESKSSSVNATIKGLDAFNEIFKLNAVKRLLRQPNISINPIPLDSIQKKKSQRLERPTPDIHLERSAPEVCLERPESKIRLEKVWSLNDSFKSSRNVLYNKKTREQLSDSSDSDDSSDCGFNSYLDDDDDGDENEYDIDNAFELPGKTKSKSEIILIPIKAKRKKKKCGHTVSCEKVVCNVNVDELIQNNTNGNINYNDNSYDNYDNEDDDCESILSINNINNVDNNTQIKKHCNNYMCDALNIEHNRCRRGIIRLNRCDIVSACDICGLKFPNNRSRMNHRNCKLKNYYQHNKINNSEILKYKYRQRELQLEEELKLKRLNNSNDDNNIIEKLKNNRDIIFIDKQIEMKERPPTPPAPSSATTITRITKLNNNKIQSDNENNLPTISLIKPMIPVITPVVVNTIENSLIDQRMNYKRILPSTLKPSNIQPLIRGIISPISITPEIQAQLNQQKNQPILPRPPPSSSSSSSQDVAPKASNQIKSTNAKNGSVYMPVRVVPIASIKSELSLEHQTKGPPRYCIIPDQSVATKTPDNLKNMAKLQATIVPYQRPSEPKDSKVLINSMNKPILIPVTSSSSSPSTSTNRDLIDKKDIYNDDLDNDNGNDADDDELEDDDRRKRSKRILKRRTNGINSLSTSLTNETDVKMSKRTIFECTYCFKTFFTEWYYKTHVAQHKKPEKYKCELCSKEEFSSASELRKHYIIDHYEQINDLTINNYEGEKLVLCDKCENIFPNNYELINHKCIDSNNGNINNDNELLNDPLLITDEDINQVPNLFKNVNKCLSYLDV